MILPASFLLFFIVGPLYGFYSMLLGSVRDKILNEGRDLMGLDSQVNRLSGCSVLRLPITNL